MKLLGILAILFVIFSGCNQFGNKIFKCEEIDSLKIYNDSIPFDKVADVTKYIELKRRFDDTIKSTYELNNCDLLVLEYLFRNAIKKYNADCIVRFNDFRNENPKDEYNIKLYTLEEEYYRQYASIIDKYGDRIVIIQCFCGKKTDEEWKKEMLSISDGGNCFFSMKINLDKRQVIYLSVNGYA